MVEALTWTHDVAVATPPPRPAHPAGLDRLPADWTVVDRVRVDDIDLDHVIVGPNGVFSVTIDPDRAPATVGSDGIYRDGVRITSPVKESLVGAHRLRRELGIPTIAYPILVTALDGTGHHLDRLGVIPGEHIAEHVWSHPGFPLRRSQRHEILWSLRRLR